MKRSIGLLAVAVAAAVCASAAFAGQQNISTTRLQNGALFATKLMADADERNAGGRVYTPAGTDSDNFNTKYPKATYTPWDAYILCGADQADDYCNDSATQMAMAFTTLPTGSQFSKGLDLALEVVDGSGGATVAIYNDNGGIPGTALAGSTQHVTATTAWGTLGPILQAAYAKRVAFANSTQYWVVVTPDADSTIAWDIEDTDYTDSFLSAFQSGTNAWGSDDLTAYVPAFDVVK